MKLVREIKDQAGNLVFRRWALLTTRWFSVYLHGMYDKRGDRDAHCHDHPWSFWGIVLWGGYFQVTHDTKTYKHRRLGLGSLFHMPAAGRYHRILSLNRDKSFSLVFASARKRLWGYWTPDGWMESKLYRARKNEGTLPVHGLHQWTEIVRARSNGRVFARCPKDQWYELNPKNLAILHRVDRPDYTPRPRHLKTVN